MSNKSNLDSLFEYLESEEGKIATDKYFEKVKNRHDIQLKQLERLHQSNNFNSFIEKVILKYESEKYVKRWYNRGIEPPEELYWFWK
jgi:hypothetical protein